MEKQRRRQDNDEEQEVEKREDDDEEEGMEKREDDDEEGRGIGKTG